MRSPLYMHIFVAIVYRSRLCLLTLLYLSFSFGQGKWCHNISLVQWAVHFSILFCKRDFFSMCSPCAWLGGWLQRERSPNIWVVKNTDSSLLLFSFFLRWVFLAVLAGVTKLISFSSCGGTKLGPCSLGWIAAAHPGSTSISALCWTAFFSFHISHCWTSSVKYSITLFHKDFFTRKGLFSKKW